VWPRGAHYLRRYAEAFLLPALMALPLIAVARSKKAHAAARAVSAVAALACLGLLLASTLVRPTAHGAEQAIETALAVTLVAAPLALWSSFATGPRGAVQRYTALVSAAFLLYVASVGGDFMGLYRFALPVVPLWAVAAALALGELLAGVLRSSVARFAAVTALLALYAFHDLGVDRAALAIGSDNGIDTPGYLKWYTDDRAAIGRWFGRYAQPDDYAVVGGAGAQVYYSGIRSLDAFGLSDEYIAHHVPPVSNRPGHEKYAPLDYQLARRPTIITSNYYNIGPAPLQREDAAAWRARGYHYVSVQIPGLSSPWYTFLKRADRRIGPLAPVDADLD
jgi:hypothetical protein